MFSEVASYRWVGSILIERLFPSGALRISRNGDWSYGDEEKIYIGYTQRDALAAFRKEFPARFY